MTLSYTVAWEKEGRGEYDVEGVAASWRTTIPETNQLTQLLSAVKPAPTALELKPREERTRCVRTTLLAAWAAICEGEGDRPEAGGGVLF